MFTTHQEWPCWESHGVILDQAEADLAAAPFCATRYTLDGVLVSLADCGRLVRDIVAGMLCGATVGLFVAMVGFSF